MGKRVLADKAKVDLSPEEFICALWARRGLAYDLLDDPMFRAQFGFCIPTGFDSDKLSDQMKVLAAKIHNAIFKKIGNGTVTLAVDGWTNVRHKKVYHDAS